MSADNYVLIKETEDGLFEGYEQSASIEELEFYEYDPIFSTPSLKEAILKAQQITTEYGYRINFRDDMYARALESIPS